MNKFNSIGLVVAMAEEQKHLYGSLGEIVQIYEFKNIKVTEFAYKNSKIFMADSGIGEISAALATQLLILKFGVQVIINFGVVGSLTRELGCKDIAYVNEIVHYDFSLQLSDKNSFGKYPFQRDSFIFKANDEMLSLAKAVVGDYKLARIVSGDKFIDDSNVKNWLINQFGGEICDMESAGICLTCRNHNIPFLMIKAVSDNADEEAAESFSAIVEHGVTFYIDAIKKLLASIAE